MKYLVTTLLLQTLGNALAYSSHAGVAPRVLRVTSIRKLGQQKCQQLEDNAEKILNEFYQPASFDCECVASLGGLKATAEYNVSCKTYKSVRRNGIFGYIHWNAAFGRTGPTKEKSCVSYYSGDCGELDNKEVCYSFDYSPSKDAKAKKMGSSPPLSCDVTVDDQVCSQCNVCDGTQTHQGIHYTAANCTNVPGMESFNYQCQDLKTVKDIRDLVFKCPKNTSPTPNPTIPDKLSKSGKSSKKGSKKGSKRK